MSCEGQLKVTVLSVRDSSMIRESRFVRAWLTRETWSSDSGFLKVQMTRILDIRAPAFILGQEQQFMFELWSR